MDPDIDPSTEIMEQVGTFLRFLRRPGRGARSEPTQPRMPSYPCSTGPQGARMRRRPYGCGCCALRAWCRRSLARCEAGGAGSAGRSCSVFYLCLPFPFMATWPQSLIPRSARAPTLVMPQKGDNIKRIRRDSGAAISVADPVHGCDERVVHITGERWALHQHATSQSRDKCARAGR